MYEDSARTRPMEMGPQGKAGEDWSMHAARGGWPRWRD